ncbi:uncharacterized protein LOC106061378 [Biomphalaria glabrata]|uniref:Uncharacterized protein LOC106061378 n=1 Tax=Biomphalaria glabrata TaxID=6526 RepID=A0A2C9L8L7_BIOGL|nr:uncharacterized protein LOC106061378 [Biomphalaria glabrata]XP_013074951.1 uncharacterized protein LOC106061378 [Biomphalaria glabrata]XP_055886354.1 uncharacterized protein LOC106061378 [Biomphalaria glabrata]XP_055886355.1 uncharacterized protein LOC106061378 [Biomphalaria glabrata]XP_055886356.1 uncharacterized protein LOC106061378 [Biomphalaria glabrata]
MTDRVASLHKYNECEFNALLSVLKLTKTEKEAEDWVRQNDTTRNVRDIFSHIHCLYEINGILKIHPIAFAQLSKEDKDEIMDKTELLRSERLTFNDLYNLVNSYVKFKSILKTFDLQHDREIVEKEITLSKLFTPDSLRDVKINGKPIFANIKPFEIKRMYDVFWKNSRMRKYIPIAKIFAELKQVDNISDFFACGEYIYYELVKMIDRETRSSKRKAEIKRKEPEILETFMQDETVRNDYIKRYTDIVNKFKVLMITEGLHFSSPMTAATHFTKHWGKVSPSEIVLGEEPEEAYLRLAREHLTLSQPIINWTQDGSSLKHIYENTGRIAVVIQDAWTTRHILATYYKI